MENDLQNLVNDYITQKQNSLLQMRKGVLDREDLLAEVRAHIKAHYGLDAKQEEELLRGFEQYIYGYSKLSPLIDDGDISDIRVVSFDNIRVKRKGKRMDAGVCFDSEKEYRQFVDYIATKNQVNI